MALSLAHSPLLLIIGKKMFIYMNKTLAVPATPLTYNRVHLPPTPL